MYGKSSLELGHAKEGQLLTRSLIIFPEGEGSTKMSMKNTKICDDIGVKINLLTIKAYLNQSTGCTLHLEIIITK